MIAGLYNIPTDDATMKRFGFYNNDAHVLAVREIRKRTGLTLPEYPIDPIPVTDFKSWLYTHQAMHNAVNLTLGLTGNDLTDVDPTRLDQMTFWIQNHALEHVAWANVLGYA